MAVYTKVSETEVADFLKSYPLGTLSELTGIRQGVENSNYRLKTSEGRYILTLYEKRVKEEDLPFFLNLMEHLAARAIPCPVPMKAKDGKALKQLHDHPTAIVSFLEGEATPRITRDECIELGRALASMHKAVQDFDGYRVNALSLDGWVELVKKTSARADEVFAGLRAVLEQEIKSLKASWPSDLPQGVIHADLFPDNVFFKGSSLCGIIDFYFACNDFLSYDLAICLNAWCFEHNAAFNITKAQAMTAGYQEVRPLSQKEKSALPLLARGSALRFLLTRLHDWLYPVPGALVKPKDPLDYLTRLQFHQRVKDVSAYGITP